jgi:lactate 2-monooxygenase
MTTPFGAYQYEVYFQGLTGVLPKLPMSYAELETRAAGVAAIGVVLRRRRGR